jgi:hypothetical protein
MLSLVEAFLGFFSRIKVHALTLGTLSEYTSKLARKSVRARRKNPKRFQDHMERVASKGGKARWQK